jgi:hypothetical protein
MQKQISGILIKLYAASVSKIVALPSATSQSDDRNAEFTCCFGRREYRQAQRPDRRAFRFSLTKNFNHRFSDIREASTTRIQFTSLRLFVDTPGRDTLQARQRG